MLNRIADSLCHPSRIGFHYKDKLWVVILHVVAFFSILIGSLYIGNIKASRFDRDDSRFLSSLVRNVDHKLDLEFNDKVLTGSALVIESENVNVYFLDSYNLPKDKNKIFMYFNEANIEIYHGSHRVNAYKYISSGFNDFKLEEVRNNIANSTKEFERLSLSALKSCDSYFLNYDSTAQALGFIASYAFVMLFVVLFSWLSNPDINMGIRIRLCLYCSLAYPFMAFLAVCFKLSILELIGLMLPILYCRIAFSRIIRVRVNKG